MSTHPFDHRYMDVIGDTARREARVALATGPARMGASRRAHLSCSPAVRAGAGQQEPAADDFVRRELRRKRGYGGPGAPERLLYGRVALRGCRHQVGVLHRRPCAVRAPQCDGRAWCDVPGGRVPMLSAGECCTAEWQARRCVDRPGLNATLAPLRRPVLPGRSRRVASRPCSTGRSLGQK